MKNFIFPLFAALAICSCKNTSEEVKSDETKIESPADTLIRKDTVAVVEQLQQEIENDASVVAEESPKAKDAPAKEIAANYKSFGSEFKAGKALSKSEMLKKYKSMKAGDTINVRFASTIREVCKKKGCWMSMELADGKESFVRFKDYGFFVPLNADQSEAIVNGKAYIDVVSVAQLQHYAKDGGKSQEEIDKITEPKITYAFQADGVLIKE
ncbi:MAG TPA: DUF4920 domain-containing protein [Flavobacterium sp.]|jgi:hypothetical protein